MKKLYNLFLLFTGVLFLASCSEDEYTYTAPETLNITKTDLYFKSAGGTGSAEIQTNRELHATSSVDWCTVVVSGNIITAQVTENPLIESRAGTINVSDGTLTSQIAVYQEGLACIIDTSGLKTANNNEAGTTSISINSSSPYTITIPQEAASWLSYTEGEKGRITFNFTANITGALRAARVTVMSGIKKVSFTIAQYEIDDLVGTWKTLYFDGEEYYQETIEITKPSEGMLDINFKSPAPGVVPVFHCVYTNGILKIQNATPQGRFQGYYLYNAVFTTDEMVSWNPIYTYSGYPNVTEEGIFTIKFDDDGSWPGKVINGIGLEAFSSPTPSSEGDIGYLLAYFNLLLYR